MNLFSIFGSITVKTEEALKGIDEVSSKAGGLASSLGKTMQDAGTKISSVGKKTVDAGKAITPLSVIASGAGGAALKMSMNFDSAMSQVSAVSGAAGKDFEMLRNKAVEMGGKTKFSASEAAEAMNYMAMAGWKTEDMLSGIEGIMNLAAASGENLGTTSDIVTDALTAFGLSASDSGHFADVLATASSNANTNVSMMGESFKYVAPVAGAMGYSVDDISVALGLMANASIKSSQAGTSLRTLLTNMASPTDQMAICMEKLGISLSDGEGNMYSFREIMDNLRSGFGNLRPEIELSEEQMAEFDMQLASLAEQYESGTISQDEYEQSVSALTESVYGTAQAETAKYAAMLAGKEGMSGLLAIINASEEDYNKLTGAIDSCNGSAKNMADIMQDNLKGDVTELMSQLEVLAISIVDLFTPSLRGIVTHVQAFVSWLMGLDDQTKMFIGTITMVVAALGPVLITIGKVISAIGSITGGIGKVITIVPKITGAVSGVIGFITSTVIPFIGTIVSTIGLVPLAIAGIIAVITVLWNKCDWFREGVIAIWEAIKSAAVMVWNAIKDFLVGLWNGIVQTGKAVFEGLATFFSACWQGIQIMFTTVLNAIKVVFGSVWEGIKNIVTVVVTAIQTFLTTAWNTITTVITTVLTTIQTIFFTVWDAIKTVVTTVIEVIKNFIVTAWEGIKSTITGILNIIKDVFSAVWNAIKTTISNVIDGVKSRISDGLNGAKSIVSDVLGAIKEKFSNIFEGAKEIVSGAIERIKGFFNFDWSLPKLKLPHFKLSGEFSLDPLSVPHIGVEWYKKAMGDGMIMNQPTIFGYNPKSNQLMAGGEAGSETVVGTGSLLDMIKAAVAAENSMVAEKLDALLSLCLTYFPRMSQMQMVTDTGALIGELSPGITKEVKREISQEQQNTRSRKGK